MRILNEMAIEKNRAMDRCYYLGSKFVEHFKKILTDDSTEAIHHHAKEMQAWYDQVRLIVLKTNNKKLNTKQIYDWFITCMSIPSELFNNEEDAMLYDDFANDLLDNTDDVIESLININLYE